MSAPQASPAGRVIRFGVYEADLTAGELRKAGRRIRLQEQPFQILSLLLERSGEIVTREEVRQQLWPADTFVDFDHSLNTAINKVREALGDSAASPHYVETIARRGYRFLVPVELVENKGASSPITHHSSPLPERLHPELQIPLPHRGITRGLFGLIQFMYLILYVVALFHLRGIDTVAAGFLAGWGASAIAVAVIVTAGIGIPLRCYLLSATAFDYQKLGEKFQRLFLYVLLLDELWAVAPFLLAQEIGFGAAFAATAALLYVPFAERTLVKMAYSVK